MSAISSDPLGSGIVHADYWQVLISAGGVIQSEPVPDLDATVSIVAGEGFCRVGTYFRSGPVHVTVVGGDFALDSTGAGVVETEMALPPDPGDAIAIFGPSGDGFRIDGPLVEEILAGSSVRVKLSASGRPAGHSDETRPPQTPTDEHYVLQFLPGG